VELGTAEGVGGIGGFVDVEALDKLEGAADCGGSVGFGSAHPGVSEALVHPRL